VSAPGQADFATRSLLQYFESSKHLPDEQRPVYEAFAELANKVVELCPGNPERTAALRKLLEGKDCAVRATLNRVDK
jgi:hypothetical protein